MVNKLEDVQNGGQTDQGTYRTVDVQNEQTNQLMYRTAD